METSAILEEALPWARTQRNFAVLIFYIIYYPIILIIAVRNMIGQARFLSLSGLLDLSKRWQILTIEQTV